MSVTISAKMVSELRAQTGAGMMDCKKALTEAGGDPEQAITILRKKGMATADKKSGREAKDGLIDAYIHFGGKVGVLIETGCETDFVAKNEDFKKFCHDLGMHIAAANPQYVSREDVPDEVLAKEREIAAGGAEGKPAHVVQKIADGKMEKFFSQSCLLEQPFVKNTSQTIQELLKEKIAHFGENIIVRRFSRYQVGE